jgi:hypothetical protein
MVREFYGSQIDAYILLPILDKMINRRMYVYILDQLDAVGVAAMATVFLPWCNVKLRWKWKPNVR